MTGNGIIHTVGCGGWRYRSSAAPAGATASTMTPVRLSRRASMPSATGLPNRGRELALVAVGPRLHGPREPSPRRMIAFERGCAEAETVVGGLEDLVSGDTG